MKADQSTIFTLNNFEGPVDFLLHLIQKSEIDIYDIPLQKIMEQFQSKYLQSIESEIDAGAEFIGTASTLLWLKSKMLLPKHEQPLSNEEDELDPRFEIIHQLIEYCRFKDAAKELSEREKEQNAFYFRAVDPHEAKKNLGVEHLTLEDLASLFKDLMERTKLKTGLIHEEVFLVSDKIKFIKQALKEGKTIEFSAFFSLERSKIELIVTFLAILELMKMGELAVIKEPKTNQVILQPA